MSSLSVLKTLSPTHKSNCVGTSMMEITDALSTATEVPRNDIFHAMFSKDSEIGATLSLATGAFLHAFVGGNGVWVQNKPKPARPDGQCYENANAEWKATGNEPLIVYEVMRVSAGFTSIALHGVNRDKRTGELYDTGNFKSSKIGSKRLCFILHDAEDTKQWFKTKKLKKGKSLDDYANFVNVLVNGNIYWLSYTAVWTHLMCNKRNYKYLFCESAENTVVYQDIHKSVSGTKLTKEEQKALEERYAEAIQRTKIQQIKRIMTDDGEKALFGDAI